MYKVKNDLAPEIVSNTFCLQMQSQYNLRQQTDFRIPSVRSVYQDCESTLYQGRNIWNYIPPELKQSSSLISFEKQSETRC